MSAVQAPYGLRAVNELGGLPYAGSTRQFPISSASANIFNGSVVAVGTNGLLTLVTTVGSDASAFPAGVVGVFVGEVGEEFDRSLSGLGVNQDAAKVVVVSLLFGPDDNLLDVVQLQGGKVKHGSSHFLSVV
jgi:hypothetical protein